MRVTVSICVETDSPFTGALNDARRPTGRTAVMKRSARDLDEPVDVDGVLVLPSNVKVRKVSFSLSNLSGVDFDDMDLITTVITHCAMHIAQKHHKIGAYLTSHKETFKGYQMLEYTVQLLMPPGVSLPDSHQLNSVHNLRPTLLQKAITTQLHTESGGYVLEVPLYSYKNEFIVVRKVITHTEILELQRVTHPTDVSPGVVKRARTAVSKSSPAQQSS